MPGVTCDSREAHRREYARLFGRLVTAMRMPASEREKWGPLIHSVAVECNRHRASALFMTEAAADARFGTVLDAACDIATTPAGPFASDAEVVAMLGATEVPA